MVHLIDKSALVVEIDLRINNLESVKKAGLIRKRNANEHIGILKGILSLINSLEVKEVDLEKEYEEFVVDDPIFGHFITNDTMGMELAKHFFELGMSVSNKT